MNQTVEKERLRRRKQNQRRARTKRFFMVLGVLVVALAAFLITVKICKPDFDFSLLVPDKAVTFVQENVLGHTTTAPTTQAPTAPPTTEKPTYADYKDAAAFAWKFQQVQKAVREKYPVTLTADAALLLAKMKDADLAPLEAAAEDAGVDPAHYYTTHTLCDAFLAKCDQARMRSFAPLFEGSADAARAALAALLPNTFLQALVWRTLTTPEAELLPEVTEHESV